MKTREELERERRAMPQERETSYIGIGGAAVIVIGAIAIGLFVTMKPDPKPVEAATTSAPAVMTDSVQCDRLIEVAAREGVVKGGRMGNRIAVHEPRWAAMTVQDRRNLMQYVACASFEGRALDALGGGDVVLVTDAASGKLLAQGGAGGVTFLPATSPR